MCQEARLIFPGGIPSIHSRNFSPKLALSLACFAFPPLSLSVSLCVSQPESPSLGSQQ
ncbi:Hypothetical protein FKW44_004075 [Caligus rogercresseyi]|uniref:Uncharacterized protein n=1 Tax=Caligus rogercresseyi TaxID=217165 RepID=A0A7T8HMB2_CALRO|nr:Hypothetical protein FKW44_004075 [Caligus rogercresseyi]